MGFSPLFGGEKGALGGRDVNAQHSPVGFCWSWESLPSFGKELPRFFGNTVPYIEIFTEGK